MPVPDFSPGEVLTAAAMDSIGLWKVASGALSGTATNFAGCFTSDFTDYRIVIDSITVSASTDIFYRYLNGTTPETSGNYSWGMTGFAENSTAQNTAAFGQTAGYTGCTITAAFNAIMGGITMDVYNPLAAERSFITNTAVGFGAGGFMHRTGFTHQNELKAFNGIQFLTNSAVTFTGTVNIYGYRK
jgi:hypothetical protein